MKILMAITLALSVLAGGAFGKGGPPPSPGEENSRPARTAAPGPPPSPGAAQPKVSKLKARIHEALLEVRRARYAQRKAKKAGDPEAAQRAETRLKEAKSRLKELRTELRRAFRKSP